MEISGKIKEQNEEIKNSVNEDKILLTGNEKKIIG